MVDQMNEQNHEDLECLKDHVAAVLNDTPEEDWCQAARHRLQNSLESTKEESWIMTLIKNKSQGKLRWAVSLPLAALLVFALIFGIPEIGGNGSEAFAQVARQLRTARTLVYTMVIHTTGMMDGKPDMAKQEIAFKEPGLMRMSEGSTKVHIMDYPRKKAISLNTKTREFIEADFKNFPDKASNVSDEIEWLRNIPEQADEVLGSKILDGRSVTGYRVTSGSFDMTAWVDSDSGDLITIEAVTSDFMRAIMGLPEAQIILSDFKFNVPLDDSLFSMEMPSGFHRTRIDYDVGSDEKHLIGFLRHWASNSKLGEGFFPPSLKPMEIAKFIKEKKIPLDQQPPLPDKASDELKKKIKENQEILQKGFMFPLQMMPENDWHYAGQGIQLGDATQPVCWWRPKDSSTYRVVLGDLSVIDMDLDQVPDGEKPLIPDRQ